MYITQTVNELATCQIRIHRIIMSTLEFFKRSNSSYEQIFILIYVSIRLR